jgi:DNA polymerase-3 subunit alpha
MAEKKKPAFPNFDCRGKTEDEVLADMAEEGFKIRMQGRSPEEQQKYHDQMLFELGVIKQMGFPGYFLIVADFIQWSKNNGVPVGPGRGSGAGSVVAWCLMITDIDPMRFDLVFERFLNPERVNMPDIDVDFCQERREKTIEYVQNHYGFDHVAQIITFGKLQAKAVIRDVGRVMQVPFPVVDRLSKMIPNDPKITLERPLNKNPD